MHQYAPIRIEKKWRMANSSLNTLSWPIPAQYLEIDSFFDMMMYNMNLSEFSRANKEGFMKGGSAEFCTDIVKTVQYAAGKDFPMKGFDNHKRVTLSARSASEQPRPWKKVEVNFQV